jgi:tetratricopeptide (TPR) repeat protein
MDRDQGDGLLIHALALFRDVVADPMRNGPGTVDVVALARAALRRKEPDAPEALAAALRACAWYRHSALDNRRAKTLLDEAVRVARTHDLPDRLAEALLTRAAVHLELGRQSAARRDIAAATPGGPGELGLHQASLLYNAGYLDAAAQLCRRALDDPASSTELRTKVANNLAMIEVQRGRPKAALELLDEATRLAAQVGPAVVAVVASSRAWTLAHAGRLTESLRCFAEAELLFEQAGLPVGELLLEQLDVLVDLRLLPEAGELGRRAVEEYRQSDAPLMAAEAALRAARIAALTGDDAGAHRLARDAVAEFRRQRRPGWTARAETLAGHAAWRLGLLDAAQVTALRRAARTVQRLGLRAAAVDAHLVAGTGALACAQRRVGLAHLDEAYALSRNGGLLVRLQGHLGAARAAHARGDDRGTRRHARSGLADLSRHRATLGSMELRVLASGHGADLGRLGLAAMLRTSGAADVLEWMERTRAAALLPVAGPVAAELRAGLAALAAVRSELQAHRGAGRAEPAELLARQTALESEVRRASWWGRGSEDSGRAVPVQEARRTFGGWTAACFGASGGWIFAVVLTERRARLVWLSEADAVQAEADATLFALRRLTRPARPASQSALRQGAEHGVDRLRALLLDPLRLDPACGLVVVPSVRTRHVPWSALHAGPTAVTPSLSLWARAARPADLPPNGIVLVAGPGLPGAVEEVRLLARRHPAARVLVPPDGSAAAVTEAIAGADLVHFACHGLLRQDNPTFSELRLTGGPMTLHELDLLGRTPARVVLAACDVAAGTSYAGDEVLGFVGALLSRGTRGVMASGVPVGDAEVVGLMDAVHAGLAAGQTMAESVHAARATMDVTAPVDYVNWCSFTAYGPG